MAIKTSSAKAKGRNLQQHCRDRILEHFNLEDGDAASTSMGAQGVDVPLSPLARRACPLSIECKNVKKLDLPAAMRQANANKYPFTYPVVVHKPYRVGFNGSLVTLLFDDLLDIVGKLDAASKRTND
jgi:hypothetical protein